MLFCNALHRGSEGVESRTQLANQTSTANKDQANVWLDSATVERVYKNGALGGESDRFWRRFLAARALCRLAGAGRVGFSLSRRKELHEAAKRRCVENLRRLRG